MLKNGQKRIKLLNETLVTEVKTNNGKSFATGNFETS